jgi:hypothetical protein
MGLFPAGVESARVDVDEGTWNGFNVRPPLFGLDRRSILSGLDSPSEGKPSIEFSLHREFDLADLPAGHVWQQWVVSINPGTEFGYKGYTLNLPYLPDLNEWYAREVLIVPHELRVEKEGVGKIAQFSEETLHLSPVEATATVYKVLDHSGIKASASLPGRKAQQLIQQMGGLEGCRVFKIQGVRKLVASSKARGGIKRLHAMEIIKDVDQGLRQASFSRFASLRIEPREIPQLRPADVFNYLLKMGVFRPGLELACPRCDLDFWLGMPVPEICHCEFCGHSFSIASHLGGRGDWHFRLSGLFGREGGEEGAIPVVLTLLQLYRIQGLGANFLYTCGTQLKSDDLDCEVDLVVIQRGRESEPAVRLSEPALLLGECKGSAEINDDDVSNLVAARELVERSGVRCYLLFSKTAAFSSDEIRRFRALERRGISPVLFTARQLEPYEPYGEVPESETLPVRYPGYFEDLARNSSWLFLRDQPAQ